MEAHLFTASRYFRMSLLCATFVLLMGWAVSAADSVAVTTPPVVQGEVSAVVADKSGAIFITGRYMGTQDFNPFTGEDSRTSAGGFDVFVTRYNADGTYGWTKTFGGTMFEASRAIVLAGKTIYVGGTFASPDAGINGTGSYAAKGLRDVFVWALDSATGATVPGFGNGGVQVFGGSGTDNLQTMIASKTSLIIAGNFDSMDAGFGGTGTISALHALDCYALMLDAKSGSPITKFGGDGVVTFGGADVDEVASVAVAGSTLFLTGSFKSLDFGYEGTTLFAPLGIRSCFVIAVNSKDGTLNTKWGIGGGIRFGGASDDRGFKLLVSGSTLYVGGQLLSNGAGLNAPGPYFSVGSSEDMFVLALSTKNGAANTKFGNAGLVQFGGNMPDILADMAISKALFVTGTSQSANASLGPSTIAAHVDKKDIVVLSYNLKDGKLATKGSFPFALFGGTEDETSASMSVGKKTVYVGGSFNSTNAGYGGSGGFKFTDFGGLLIPFDIVTGGLPVKKSKMLVPNVERDGEGMAF